MHLFFYARGVYNQVELFKTLAQGQFWKWTRHNLETDKDETILVQGALRPTVLGAYEYIIPEDCLEEALAILGVGQLVNAEIGIKPQLKLAALRKIFGAKKITKKMIKRAQEIPQTVMINNTMRGLHHLIIPGVTIHFIGYKKDDFRDCDFSKTGQGKYHQEFI